MMTVETIRWRHACATLFIAAAILTSTGCASLRQRDAASTEELLTAAGFQKRPADTPEQLADLTSMPSRKLVARSTGGKVVYMYADPEWCRCLYVGGHEEYAAYGRLTLRQVMRSSDVAEDGLHQHFPYSWR